MRSGQGVRRRPGPPNSSEPFLSSTKAKTLCFICVLVVLWSITFMLFFSIDYSGVDIGGNQYEGTSKARLRAKEVERSDLMGEAYLNSEKAVAERVESAVNGAPAAPESVATTNVPSETPPKDSANNGDSSVIPIIIFTHNRAFYLRKCLDQLFKFWPGVEKFPIFVSQDGDDGQVSKTISEYKDKVEHWRHSPSSTGAGPGENQSYYKIAQHYGWALEKAFADPNRYQQVIMLEEDIQIAPDFFTYFQATRSILQRDNTLMAVSAWNDNGKEMHVGDPEKLYRSDFFPGLGWMMPRRIWQEWGPKWTKGYWDDWVREPAQRKGRAVIRPEISRTFTFGERGVSGGQFYNDHLVNIKLNDVAVSWGEKDLSMLMKKRYDEEFAEEISNAKVTDFSNLSADEDVPVLKYIYKSDQDFDQVASRLRIMTDRKAGVPRTAYLGVVSLKYKKHTIHLVGSSFPVTTYQQ